MPHIPRWAFVIDLETTDTLPSAEVLTIGIAAVDAAKMTVIDENLHLAVSLDGQMNRTRSTETIDWWKSIGGDAKAIAWGQVITRQPVMTVLAKVNQFLLNTSSTDSFTVWGNGATFDISILESLFRDAGVTVPWSYRQVRDLRTIYEAAGAVSTEETRKGLTPHIALDDAVEEARRLLLSFKVLGLSAPPKPAAAKATPSRDDDADIDCFGEP